MKDHWHSSDIPIRLPLHLASNLLPLHSICLASGSKFHPHYSPLMPSLPPSAPLLLLGCCSCSWCGLASRAKGDTMHNYVVRGHHDGNISVLGHHIGILSLCILLCAALIKWRHMLSTVAAGEIQLVLVFTNLSSLLERFWQEVLLLSWLQQWRYFYWYAFTPFKAAAVEPGFICRFIHKPCAYVEAN